MVYRARQQGGCWPKATNRWVLTAGLLICHFPSRASR
uniref:Uncharacterized protein n=1 Tax=Anguilla anguilla TaxID=7936 RepID=A0A0E9SAA1_ANGAN